MVEVAVVHLYWPHCTLFHSAVPCYACFLVHPLVPVFNSHLKGKGTQRQHKKPSQVCGHLFFWPDFVGRLLIGEAYGSTRKIERWGIRICTSLQRLDPGKSEYLARREEDQGGGKCQEKRAVSNRTVLPSAVKGNLKPRACCLEALSSEFR